MPTYDCLEAVLRWGGAPGQGYFLNVLHIGAGLVELDQALTDDIAGILHDDFVGSNFLGRVVEDVFMDKVTVKDLRVADGPAFESPILVGGGNGGQVNPAQLALVTTLRTAVGSRRGRGRIYNAGFSSNDVNAAGGVADGVAADVTAYWNAVVADLSAHDPALALVVLSKTGNEVNEVTGVFTDSTWDTQRRRIR